MERGKFLAIVLLFSVLRVIPALCNDWAEGRIWQNQGGSISNRREALFERKISRASVTSLSLKWTAPTGHDVSSTPSIDGRLGAVYFSSWDGCQYAVKKDTGALIWNVNLTEIAPTIPGLVEGIFVVPFLKSLALSNGTGLADLVSRATPTIAGPLLIFGIFSPCYVLALNRSTGAVVWWTSLDSHPFCVFTQSGTYYKGSFFIGTSSMEEASVGECCTFEGAFFKLDAKTGKTLWRTPMLPDNNNQTGLYAGAGIWGSSPSIDVARKLVYIATGNTYSLPPAAEACANASRIATSTTFPDPCISSDDHSESIVAIDISSGKISWAAHLGGYDVWTLVCALSPVPLPNCPIVVGGDYDFGEAPLLLTIKEAANGSRKSKDILVAGQKSGVVHALDRATGDIVWQTDAGPGGTLGGASWGMTTDGERVFTNIINNESRNFTLVPSSKVITWGGWVGMNATTGKVLWSTANPVPFGTLSPVAHANGIIFGASTGNATSGSPSGLIVALDAVTGAIVWNYTTKGAVGGGASIMDGCVFHPVGLTILGLGSTPSPDIHGRSIICLCVP